MKHTFNSLIFIFLFASQALAGDILFLDLNNAIPELDVVQDWLEKAQDSKQELNTKLVIVPSMNTFNMETRIQVEKLHAELDHIMKKNVANPTNSNTKMLAKLGRQIRTLTTGDPNTRWGKADAIKELKQVLEDPSYQFDRVFISGHHESRPSSTKAVMGGEFVHGIQPSVLGDLFNNAPTTRNVHSLFLLGCNTATEKMMGSPDKYWSVVLPWAALQLGYNAKAPVKNNPINLSNLKKMLSLQKFVASVTSKGHAEDLDSINGRLIRAGFNGYFGYRLGGEYHQHPKK